MIRWSQVVSSTCWIWSSSFRCQLYRLGQIGFPSPSTVLSTLVQPFWFGGSRGYCHCSVNRRCTSPRKNVSKLTDSYFDNLLNLSRYCELNSRASCGKISTWGLSFCLELDHTTSCSLVWKSRFQYLVFKSTLGFRSWEMSIKPTSILVC